MGTTAPQGSTLLERRLASEWSLLLQLSEANPGRIGSLRSAHGEFHLILHGPEAARARGGVPGESVSDHAIRIDFPVHFPAVPMELFLEMPMFHPNIHPETGFVCLWERHRVSNTVEHALHKAVAMLAGELWNPHALHVMQPEALPWPVRSRSMPLAGVAYEPLPGLEARTAVPRRRRLQ